MKDALLFNKIAAAVLAAALLAMVTGALSRILYTDHTPEEPAYVIATGESASAAATDEPKKPAGPAPIADMLASADVEKGAKLFKKCGACHDGSKGGPNKVGPNLWNVVNRPKGSHESFGGYSSAMKSFGGEWSYEELNHFLFKPKAYIDGTAMTFAGFKKDKDRANIIAYLRTLSDNPAPLP